MVGAPAVARVGRKLHVEVIVESIVDDHGRILTLCLSPSLSVTVELVRMINHSASVQLNFNRIPHAGTFCCTTIHKFSQRYSV